MALTFSEAAVGDLTDIRSYIAAENPAAAARIARRLLEACDVIERHPGIGRAAARPGIREFVVPPYVIAYSEGAGDVVILRVWHRAQGR